MGAYPNGAAQITLIISFNTAAVISIEPNFNLMMMIIIIIIIIAGEQERDRRLILLSVVSGTFLKRTALEPT